MENCSDAVSSVVLGFLVERVTLAIRGPLRERACNGSRGEVARSNSISPRNAGALTYLAPRQIDELVRRFDALLKQVLDLGETK